MDTFYLIPWTLLCLQEWMTMMMTDTSLAGVQGDDTSLAGVPIPVMTNNDNDDSDAESDHNSIDPNEADDNSSKASVLSTRSQAPIHSMTVPLDEEEPDDTQ